MESARAATVADIAQLAVLEAEQRAEAAADARGGHMWLATDAERRPPLAELIGDPDAEVVVGAIDSVPLGFAAVRILPIAGGERVASITNLFVTPDARGVGVGEAIMEHVLAWARSRGVVGVDAQALPGDRATKNFFETHGLVARMIVVHRALP